MLRRSRSQARAFASSTAGHSFGAATPLVAAPSVPPPAPSPTALSSLSPSSWRLRAAPLPACLLVIVVFRSAELVVANVSP
ncbi:hypothetical protein NL676_007297 [Syzygium grande]|nr:hypothetical protein NL676_007297 [Syzygium grande]